MELSCLSVKPPQPLAPCITIAEFVYEFMLSAQEVLKLSFYVHQSTYKPFYAQ